jgi:hypothetical protein
MFHNVYMLISNFWWMHTYTYGLFGNIASISDYKGFNGRTIRWKTIGKDVEWSGHYLISGIILTCDWKNWEKLQNTMVRIVSLLLRFELITHKLAW